MVHRAGGSGVERAIAVLVGVRRRDLPQHGGCGRHERDLHGKLHAGQHDHVASKKSHRLCYRITRGSSRGQISMRIER